MPLGGVAGGRANAPDLLALRFRQRQQRQLLKGGMSERVLRAVSECLRASERYRSDVVPGTSERVLQVVALEGREGDRIQRAE
eukprot:7735525-Pyramimonas_sp.AAC.1